MGGVSITWRVESVKHKCVYCEGGQVRLAGLEARLLSVPVSDGLWRPQEVEEKSALVLELEAQVEYLRGEQERLKRGSEEEVEQLHSVIEKLQQEISNIEHKQSPEDQEEDQEEEDGSHEELKQKMDEVVKELDTLKVDHSSLLGRYEGLQRETLQRVEEKERSEEALRDRTAALVVAQAQVQALEESAGTRVTELTRRVEELKQCVEEKELELQACRRQVEKAQEDAETLHLKVSQLEDTLREKVRRRQNLSRVQH